MIKIQKILDQSIKNHLINEYNLNEYKNCDFYAVFDNEIVIEFAAYAIVNDCMEFKFVSNLNNDFSLIYGLIKTVLFAADIKTTSHATLPLNYETVAKSIGFIEYNNIFILKFDDYQNQCNH